MLKSKKSFVIGLALLMLVAIVSACGKDNNDSKPAAASPKAPASESASTPVENKKIVLGFSQIGQESGWRDAETSSIKDTFGNDPQFELKFSDGQQKQENQIKAIRSFIAQKVDAIGLAPVVETGWDTVLKEAKDAGIPVFLLDRTIKVADDSLYVAFIGSDFIEEGHRAAKFLKETFGDKDVNVVELQGSVGASAANDRKKGFEEEIAGSKIKILKSQTGEFTRAKGKEVMEAFLKSDKANIDAVYAHNDDMAIGAIQAIEEAGLKPGTDIIVASIDGVKAAFEAIAAGKLNVTVECNPLLGPQLKQAILDTLDGKTVDKWIKSDEDVYSGQKAIDALPNRKY